MYVRNASGGVHSVTREHFDTYIAGKPGYVVVSEDDARLLESRLFGVLIDVDDGE